MNLHFDATSVRAYRSNSQLARVLTERWVEDNMFCPRCGRLHIEHFPNNRPVADFYCPECHSEYELKSRNGSILKKVNDGAYSKMIQRITSNKNPDFFFMNYSKAELCVRDFVFVSKYFFVPNIIEKRPPLAESARRPGWVGCKILLDKIPEQGRVEIVSGGVVRETQTVLAVIQKNRGLETGDIETRGWLMDILNCVNQIPTQQFTLGDVYAFEEQLALKHSQNRNIRPKIRQQLQVLRDKGFLEFMGRGVYRKK